MLKAFLITILLIISIRGDSYSDFQTFTDSIWSQFNLNAPASLQECFNATTSTTFFSFLADINDIATDMINGNLSEFMLIDFQDELIDRSDMQTSMECAVQTSDYTNLLQKLEFQSASAFTNLTNMYTLMWNWASAYPQFLQKATESILGLIESGNLTHAGFQAAILLDEINYSNIAINLSTFSIISFYNGIFLGLNLDYPSSAAQCFAQYNESLPYLTTFYLNLFERVGNSRTIFLYYNAKGYYDNLGKTYYSQVPSGLWTCLSSTSDQQTLKQKLGFGFDPYDSCYLASLFKYLSSNYDNLGEYGGTLNKIYERLLPNYFEAGSAQYRTILQAVAPFSADAC